MAPDGGAAGPAVGDGADARGDGGGRRGNRGVAGWRVAEHQHLELSETEIAETLGVSRGSVKAHASRGSAALRRLLSDQLHEGDL